MYTNILRVVVLLFFFLHIVSMYILHRKVVFEPDVKVIREFDSSFKMTQMFLMMIAAYIALNNFLCV
jgi:hypothetical protein